MAEVGWKISSIPGSPLCLFDRGDAKITAFLPLECLIPPATSVHLPLRVLESSQISVCKQTRSVRNTWVRFNSDT